MWLRDTHLAGFLNTVLTEALGLLLGALILPGTTINLRGFLVAMAVIVLPPAGFDLYMRNVYVKDGHPQHLGRWGLGFVFQTVWLFGGLAFADWITPNFNIGGVWQYVVLWLIILGVSLGYWQVVRVVAPATNTD